MKLQEFKTPGTYKVTVAPGSSVLVEAWGGGGGGGGGCIPVAFGGAGGGGGSGAYVRAVVIASPADGTLTITVGAGGAAGASAPPPSHAAGQDGQPGTNGGDTTVSTGGAIVVTARGGGGGKPGRGGGSNGSNGTSGEGGAGGAGIFPADSGLTRNGANGANGYNDIHHVPKGGAGGSSYIASGPLPSTPPTGGSGGNPIQASDTVVITTAGNPGCAVLTLLDSPTAAGAGVPSYTGQQLIPLAGQVSGHTINSQNSYVTVACAGGTMTLQVVLRQTNQPGKTFHLVYTLDGGDFFWTGVNLTTDANGNGTAALTVPGLTPGTHRLTLWINNTPQPGNTYYVNSGYQDKPITFTC
ncbi:glycine-rich domain-containing protein [Streptosporangium sp. LJ11]|uniref:glycine-rich domain-containing protein n=1 Tax=Streptosporangium sp. LJ11 TaxID=3436927 RepID=UPI003F78C278